MTSKRHPMMNKLVQISGVSLARTSVFWPQNMRHKYVRRNNYVGRKNDSVSCDPFSQIAERELHQTALNPLLRHQAKSEPRFRVHE